MKNIVLSVMLALCGPVTASAAEFQFITGQADPPGERFYDGMHCNIRLSGEIVAGDADRFEFFLASIADRIEADEHILGTPRIASLCLNSDGGSLNEAIQIAEQIRKDRPFPMRKGIPFVATRLDAGAVCNSACAIIFLAGTYDDFEGAATPLRSMHPTATLGFHAPALNIGEGQFDARFVAAAYDTSITAIAEIMRVLHLGENAEGGTYSGGGFWMSTPLLAEMLKTPSSDMRYVQTVDDAGRFGIPVRPFMRAEVTPASIFTYCTNRQDWSEGRSATKDRYSNEAFEIDTVTQDYPPAEIKRYFVSINELDGIGCTASVRDNGQVYFDFSWGGGAVVNGGELPFYDPATTLASLAPEGSPAPTPAAGQVVDVTVTDGVPWFPRFGGDKITMWDHNGSIMAWESRSNVRWVWYYKPREGIAKIGVTPGTLLFEAVVIDGEIRATSRIFSRTCGEQTFRAFGPAQGTRIVLEGQYRSRDKSCNEGALKTDVSVFDYIGDAPADPNKVDGTAPEGRFAVIGVRTGLNMRDGPSPDAAKIGELPAGQAGLQLINCVPAMRKPTWGNADTQARARLLSERWCSLSHDGVTGYVSGRFLAEQ